MWRKFARYTRFVSPEQSLLVESIAREHAQGPGPLLVVLHAIQDRLGFVPRQAVPVVAEVLNLSVADVHGVVTFYHHFRHEPQGACVIQLCRAEACLSMGAESLARHVRSRLGCNFGETTADGRYSLMPVYCLGNCARAPAAFVGDELLGCATPERIDERIDARAERA